MPEFKSLFQILFQILFFLSICPGLFGQQAGGSPDSGGDRVPSQPSRGHDPKSQHGQHGQHGPLGSFQLKVPQHSYDLILNRPERDRIGLSILAYEDLEGFLTYQPEKGSPVVKTVQQSFLNGTPVEVPLEKLSLDTSYVYQFHYRKPGAAEFTVSPVFSFHTARLPGKSFRFTLTADAHLDEHTSPEVYLKTLENIRAEKPDLHIDLGNLFMTDKHPNREEMAKQYLAESYYMSLIGHSIPLFLVLGTHDGEGAKNNDGSTNCLAAWANNIRERYFLNPTPDDFYSGNQISRPNSVPSQNYYSWEWGDALFVVLDPFGYSESQRGGGREGWGWSLGKTQYDWLKKTLSESKASYKFVFIHNMLSGDQATRGGVEIAGFNEWGGKNKDGSEGFRNHRPGWPEPVHKLFQENHVTVLFRAHDNFYARQNLDGITYLMVPQPSFTGDDRIRDLQNYGYKDGTFLGNSGHVLVTVTPEGIKTDYVRTLLSTAETPEKKNGMVADHAEISPGAIP